MAGLAQIQAPRLVALDGAITPREYMVKGDVFTLGRAEACSIVITGELISRLHATITRVGPRYWISDSNSRNGTYVNAVRLEQAHMLSDGDLIGLGRPSALLRFVDPDPTSEAPPEPPEAGSVARLVYDPLAMVFTIDGTRLELTRAQLFLLGHLYRHAGEVCTRESCAEAIWGRDYAPGIDAGALDQAFNALRRTLAGVDPSARWIRTRRGLGYVLSLTGAADAGSETKP